MLSYIRRLIGSLFRDNDDFDTTRAVDAIRVKRENDAINGLLELMKSNNIEMEAQNLSSIVFKRGGLRLAIIALENVNGRLKVAICNGHFLRYDLFSAKRFFAPLHVSATTDGVRIDDFMLFAVGVPISDFRVTGIRVEKI